MKRKINDDEKLIRKGGRFAIPYTEEQLKRKIEELTKDVYEDEYGDIDEAELYELVEILLFYESDVKHCKVATDLRKVDFDAENIEADEFGEWCNSSWLGFHTTDTGFTYLGCAAGGDGEYPVFFAIYFDGKDLRGYIPQYHNTYNIKTKEAFGHKDTPEAEINAYLGLETDTFDIYDTFEDRGLFEDIESRVQIR